MCVWSSGAVFQRVPARARLVMSDVSPHWGDALLVFCEEGDCDDAVAVGAAVLFADVFDAVEAGVCAVWSSCELAAVLAVEQCEARLGSVVAHGWFGSQSVSVVTAVTASARADELLVT